MWRRRTTVLMTPAQSGTPQCCSRFHFLGDRTLDPTAHEEVGRVVSAERPLLSSHNSTPPGKGSVSGGGRFASLPAICGEVFSETALQGFLKRLSASCLFSFTTALVLTGRPVQQGW